MSITAIKPYLSSKLKEFGLTEWEDGFGDDNIPSTILDRSFHQRFISASGVSTSQETFEMLIIHSVKIYFKGFNSPAMAIDEALLACQTIIADLLNYSDFMSAGLKGLSLDSFTVEPMDATVNDNIVMAEIVFNIRVFNCIS